MADVPARRTSQLAAAPAVSSSGAIPPPPPLPPSASAAAAAHPQRTSYFSRFVTQPLTAYGARPLSAQASLHAEGGRPNPFVPRLHGLRTGLSQDTSHKTGLDITALDTNRDHTHAVLAGKDILKTVRVTDAKIVDDTNLRAAAAHYADRTTPARQRDGLGIHDVKWSHGQFAAHIATAAANGKVILYDLNRAGLELARLHEHSRQVHKLAFNPHQGYLLLSASHDNTVRLWDLRDMRKDIMTCPSRDQYHGMNGGIRDVQWCPTDAVEFAFGTDNGNIQRWDYRHNKGPKQKVTAHDQRTCTSIDWHPDGKHLLSAGVDKTVKVWDFSADGRRQKAAFVLTTPHAVHKARWRPPYWSDEHYEKGAYQCTQIATSYDRDHSSIHVWDFRRPYLPFREINKFSTAPSDMLWHSRDTLWTVGREGVFQQSDIHLAPKVVDRRNLQTFAVSPTGEIGGLAQRRPRRRRSVNYSAEDAYMGDKRSNSEKNSLRSSADDSLDDGLLSSALRNRHHGRTASNRSARSFGSTPPSESAAKVMFLTDSMAVHNDSGKPNQVAFRGVLPGSPNMQIFAYLAQKYKAIALPEPATIQSYLDVAAVFEQNAEYAQRASLYRLAETWRIVGVSVSMSTRRRAELHKQRRRLQYEPPTVPSNTGTLPTSHPLATHDQQLAVPPNPAVRALLGAIEKPMSPRGPHSPQSIIESTSNLATPSARPQTATNSTLIDARNLPDPDHAEDIRLPPAANGPHSSEKGTLAASAATPQPHVPNHPSFNAPQWSQSPSNLDEKRALIGSWRVQPRAPLSLELPEAQAPGINVPSRLDRHDSEESFAMFSASSDSQRGASVLGSFTSGESGSHRELQDTDWHRSAAESSFGRPRHADTNVEQHLGTATDQARKQSSLISPTTVPINMPDGASMVGQNPARDGSALSSVHNSREQAVLDIENLRKNNKLLRHDSSESEAMSSLASESSLSTNGFHPDMEASGTIVPDVHEDVRIPQEQRPHPVLSHAVESAPPDVDMTAEDPLVLSDFEAMHVDADDQAAFSIVDLLRSILNFHAASLSDAQTSSLLLLLLAPILPQTQTTSITDEPLAADVLSNFSDVLQTLGFTPTQTDTVLSTELTQLLATGINPYQAEAILQTYHAQLHSLSLFNAAASLRRLAYPLYPAVYEQAMKDTQLGLLCLSCKSPINNPKDKMRCETCKRAQAPCPICWGRYAALEPATASKRAKAKLRSSFRDKDHKSKRTSLVSAISVSQSDGEDLPSPSVPVEPSPPKATLWTWCPLCGHGGHTNCLTTWFASTALSDGACATEGCLCDCVQGLRRDQKIRDVLAKKAEKERSKVVRKGDDWKVSESKAVSAIRGTLGDAATRARESGDKPQVPVPSSGRKDDGKRVRVVKPNEGRRPRDE